MVMHGKQDRGRLSVPSTCTPHPHKIIVLQKCILNPIVPKSMCHRCSHRRRRRGRLSHHLHSLKIITNSLFESQCSHYPHHQQQHQYKPLVTTTTTTTDLLMECPWTGVVASLGLCTISIWYTCIFVRSVCLILVIGYQQKYILGSEKTGSVTRPWEYHCFGLVQFTHQQRIPIRLPRCT